MSDRLLLLPSLSARFEPDGRVDLTRKFVEGVQRFVREWDGRVTVALERRSGDDGNLDHETWALEDLDFQVLPVDFRDQAGLRALLRDSAVALGTLYPAQTELAAWSREEGTPFVYTTEYTLRTRWQIAGAEVTNPLRRLRRQAWETEQEVRYRRAVAASAGLQCNGLPTWNAYRELQPEALLFFDTRTSTERVIDAERLEAKAAAVQEGRPLRLGFSGRLNRMKGADHLIEVAAGLRRRGVPFSLDVWGGGPLEAELRRRIAQLGVAEQVRLHGVVDFATALVPAVQADIDVFVMNHRQGDPSCTYVETLACGVPIVGYGNEAWAGLAGLGPFGWVADLDHVGGVVDHLARLHVERAEIAGAMRAARSFALEHVFERSFARRTEQLLRLATDGPVGQTRSA